jgi:hypothetical protein
MPNTVLTEKTIKKRIETRLGSSGVAIELEDDDIKEVIAQAIELYNQIRPGKRRAGIAASTQQRRYVIVDVNGNTNFPGIAGIVDVQFITRRTQPAQVDPFDPFDTALAGVTLGSGSGETYGEIAQRLMYSEDAARIVDSEPEWHSDWEGAELVLYLDIVRSHVEAAMEYSVHYAPDNNADTGMQLIPNGDVEILLRYMTAVAKIILGRIRVKHGGTVNPDGGVDEIDGAALLQEGSEDMTSIREEMERRRVPLAPTTPE